MKLILAAMYTLYSIPGFENPGHAGHLCPVIFEIGQTHWNFWVVGRASHFSEGAGLASGSASHFSTSFFYYHLAGCKQANRSILSQTYKKLFSKPAKYYISKMICLDIKKKIASKEQTNWL